MMSVEGIVFVSLFLGFCIFFFGMIFIFIAGMSGNDLEEIARMQAELDQDNHKEK